MRALLVSIKPKFADLIFSGRKTVELRRTCPKGEEGKPMEFTDQAFICHGKHIHGYMIIKQYFPFCICNREMVRKQACVTKAELEAYKPKFCWCIVTSERFMNPIPLDRIESIKRAPQSWQYLTGLQEAQIHLARKGGKA